MEAIRHFESPYVDLETGEVLDSTPAGIEAQQITVKDLPQVGRNIARLQKEAEKIAAYRKTEVERIQAFCERRLESMNNAILWLLKVSEGLMQTTGETKVEYPGIGRFRWRKLPVSVNSEEYDNMTDEEQVALHSGVHQGCFKKKVTVSPDKNAIKKALTQGKSIPGFALMEPPPKFEFKAEE